MSAFDETSVRRQPQGVTSGGQFATQPKSEADVLLAGADNLPADTEVAFRNPLPDGPRWLEGVVTYDAPLAAGQVGVVVGEGPNAATYTVAGSDVLPWVEPAEYDGDDVDSYADAWGWTGGDWEHYYDGRAEREQGGAFEEGKTSATELEHPAGVGRVTTFVGDDGVPVFQIDTDGDTGGRVRVNLNDAPVWDGDPETDEQVETQIRNLLAGYEPFEAEEADELDLDAAQRREEAYREHCENAAGWLDQLVALLRARG